MKTQSKPLRDHSRKTLLQSFIVLLCATALAQDGNVIAYQGQLADQADQADQAGQPLTPPTPVTIVFRLYQAPVGGAAIVDQQIRPICSFKTQPLINIP